MRKYGLVNFQFEIIEECKAEELNEREQFWISHYNTYEDRQHYNLSPDGNILGETQIERGEDSPMALLTEEQVIFCRNLYKNGENGPIVVWQEYFQEDIEYSGFVRMYTGQTWSHIIPEVFLERFGNRRFSYEDVLKFKQEFEESGLSLNQFSKMKKGIVGYGTLWRMVNTPNVYKPKK